MIVPFKKLPQTKAWKITSELIRAKSKGKCYTCGGRFPMNKLVAGHFREKIGNSGTYFDLDNLRAQCQWYCNRVGHGRKDIYSINLIKEIGLERVNNLFKKSQKSKVWTKDELDKIYEERLQMLKEIKK